MIDTIILAGGLGTRARPYLGDLPKCLAPVGGRPLLYHLLGYLESQGIKRVCLALSHEREQVLDYIGQPPRYFCNLLVHCDLDTQQRGTGGAVTHVLAARLSTDTPFGPPLLVLNGDTLLRLDLRKLYNAHISEGHSYTTAVAGTVPVARILDQKAIEMLKYNSSLETALPVNRGVVLHCDPGCYVDIGTADGYARSQEWVKLGG